MKRNLVYPVLCIVIQIYALAGADAQHAREVAEKTMPSVVLIVTEDSHGQELAIGSGFVVKDGVVASNAHVMEGASRGYIKLVDQKTKFNIEGYVGRDLMHDLVLLLVKDITAPVLKLGNSSRVKTGDTVFAIGNPRGLEGTFSQGIVSSVRKVETDSLLQITAAISPGSSGGPVVGDDAAVVGISVATFRGGQNLNFAIPVEYLNVLVTKPVIIEALSDKKGEETKKSYIEDLGSRVNEGVSGRALLWTYSSLDSGNYSFSLQNRLRENVKNVRCLVIFFDRSNEPIDFQLVTYDEVIPGGLGKRVKGQADEGVKKLTTGMSPSNQFLFADEPETKVEFRILDFDIVSD